MPSPNRSFFRFHLLTAILLSFTAGGLIKLNLGPVKSYVADYWIDGDSYDPVVRQVRILGWPFPAQTIVATGKTTPTGFLVFPIQRVEVIWLNSITDLLIALLILLAVALLSEWHCRKRAVKSY